MASQVNGYRNFIDIQNKEGQLVSNAIDRFISPLAGDERVSLLVKDFKKLKDNLLQLGLRYAMITLSSLRNGSDCCPGDRC
jgi:hypothetical protein